jgi:hypothetical protein
MRALRFILLLAFVSWAASRADVVVSQSQQFYVHGSRSAPNDVVPAGSTWVRPDFLAVTAERVKQGLAAELPAISASAAAAIHLTVVADASHQMPVGIVSTKFSDGWAYYVAVPQVVDQTRLVKALVQVMLVEFANRAPGRGAEIPPWLVEGMAQELFFSVGPKLVVDQQSTGWQIRIRDMQRRTREVMRTNSTPTFKELTMASPPPDGSTAELLYQSASHFLVRSLLQSQNGRQRFASFLQTLPQTWNWQTALREAYGFSSMLEVEKWWALTTLEFTTHDLRQAWSMESSLRRLNELLNTTLQVRGETNALPELRTVDLKTLLREENWSLQREALQEKIMQLNYTAAYFSPAAAGLAYGYKDALDTYVKKRDHVGAEAGLRMTPEARTQALVSDLGRRLEALESKRRALSEPNLTAR